jgi:NAD(P)-dependent dehydrogenase (short-subunit alcohol dehydrogenase family)
MTSLNGKVALVTGAGGGMGSAIARLLAAHGAAVVIADVRDEMGHKFESEIVNAGGIATYRHLDVTSEAAWIDTIAAVEAWRGRLDILVNNAGINVRGPIGTLALEDFNKVLAVNLGGPLLAMKHAAPAIARAGGGSIVNITSNISLIPSRSAAYAASKWGLRGLAKTAALEYAPMNIRVNSVGPGVVPTDINVGQPYLQTTAAITPLGRIATANDIANAVLFLVSDAGAFITGVDLPVDGGFVLGHVR